MEQSTEKLNYYLPDFYRNAELYSMLIGFMEHIPQWFYEDVKISAVYGCFPNCIWNGGRAYLGNINKTRMKKIVELYNQHGIPVRYTFTNPLIEEKHVTDIFANICVEVANNGMNEILVNSPALEAYIRKNYPDFRLISSTTKCLMDEEKIREELEKDYYLVVLDSSLNNSDMIFRLDKKEKIELLVDHSCRVHCPNRKEHYIASGKAQLEYDLPQFHTCPYVGRSFEELKNNNPSFISKEMILGKYREAGFRHFKLDGRTFTAEKLVESILYYFVKPEFRDKMKGIIQKEVYDKIWASYNEGINNSREVL